MLALEMAAAGRRLSLLILALCLTACARDRLHVQNDYLTVDDLASYQVNTPDHRREDPPIGQRLTLYWSLPDEVYDRHNEISLFLKLRFKSGERREIQLPLDKRQGTYIYRLLDEQYYRKKGIQTYRAEIRGDKGKLIEAWTHHLWTELIEVGSAS